MDPRLTRGALQWIRIESAWLNRKSVRSLGLRRPFSRDLEAATSAHTQKVRAEAAGTTAARARRLPSWHGAGVRPAAPPSKLLINQQCDFLARIR